MFYLDFVSCNYLGDGSVFFGFLVWVLSFNIGKFTVMWVSKGPTAT